MTKLNTEHIRAARDDVLTRECLVRFIDTTGLISERAREVNGLLILGADTRITGVSISLNFYRAESDPSPFVTWARSSVSGYN